jgi:hypothetical protein
MPPAEPLVAEAIVEPAPQPVPVTVEVIRPSPAQPVRTVTDLGPWQPPNLRSKPTWRRTGWIVGAVLLGIVALGALVYFRFIYEIEEPVTAADRAVVITAEHVAKFQPGFRPNPGLGNFKKVRHLDGSMELTYEFETPDGAEVPLYVYCLVGVEPTTSDAKSVYAGLGLGEGSQSLTTAVKVQEQLQEVERNDLWGWGDKSRCALLKTHGEIVGNFFMARKGRRYFALVITGVCFEDPPLIVQLLGPMLERLENYAG